MLRPKEVCRHLGISYVTLREYVKEGYIKPVVLQSWRVEVQRRGRGKADGNCEEESEYYTLGYQTRKRET